MTDIYRFLERGGPLMIPIILGSIAALGIFLERLYMLQRSRVVPEDFVKRVRKFIREGRQSEARTLCQNGSAPVAAVLAAVFRELRHGRDRMKEAVEDIGKREVAELERYLEALGTIAAIEPLLGLLGTVTGLIKVFQSVPLAGVPDPGALATGIWEALITTAAGLSVALPTFVAYKYVSALVGRLALDMESAATDVIAALGVGPEGAEGSHPSPAAGSAGDGGGGGATDAPSGEGQGDEH